MASASRSRDGCGSLEAQRFENQNSIKDENTFSFPAASPKYSDGPQNKLKPDKYAHTRAKRKRTSREDFSVLESEYQRDPRPDKATRSGIVSRVSLSDKEVQIWFQNRRQMTRRKCKTWQPNEITSIIRSSQESKEDFPTSDASFTSSQSIETRHDTCHAIEYESKHLFRLAKEEVQYEYETIDGEAVHSNPTQKVDVINFDPAAERETVDNNVSPSLSSLGKEGFPAESGQGDTAILPQWDPEGTHTDTPMVEKSGQGVDVNSDRVDHSRAQLKRATSAVRLSMSLDGSAKVILADKTPSPPKKSESLPIMLQRSNDGLQRSQSLITSVSDAQPSSEDGRCRKHRTHGRSRDARTWEFYCDNEARNSLNKAAELDRQGSALGMIGLIRSGSGGRKPLRPVENENAFVKRKRTGYENEKITKLARTTSSVARLQTPSSPVKVRSKGDREVKTWEDPFGDSDKENWDPPGTIMFQCGQVSARLSGVHKQGISKENSSVMSHSNSLEALTKKEYTVSGTQRTRLLAEDQEKYDSLDHEVVAFMGDSADREDDEMDAVQNLLSLSQGAWTT